MTYRTQAVAYPFFVAAIALFVVQVLVGALAGTVYVFPHFLSETLPFHVLRMIHTNALLVWLLLGFFGATYFLIPEETERDIESPMLAYLQLGLMLVAALGAVAGYPFGIHEGREYLEQPLWSRILITASVLIFLYNVSITALRGRRTAVTVVLLLGLWLAGIFYFFNFWNPANLALDKMYWWWIVHIWVEGVWELIMAAILAFLMIKLTGIDREVIDKWMYVIVALALFSGLLGTGHHYYWIGTPGYWQWLGSIFSTLEVLPFFAMVLFAFYMIYRGGRDHANKAALLWSLGCPVMAFFGAGVWGFMHTLSPVNFYSHGTQVTAAHAHLAFYGAYVMLNLAIITYAMPQLRRVQPYLQVPNMWSFWIISSAVAFMTFTLTFAGVVQTHLQRVLGRDYMSIQDQIWPFYAGRLGAGIVVVAGVLLFAYAIFGPVRQEKRATPEAGATQPAE